MPTYAGTTIVIVKIYRGCASCDCLVEYVLVSEKQIAWVRLPWDKLAWSGLFTIVQKMLRTLIFFQQIKAISLKNAVVLNLGSIEPPGFDGAVFSVRRRDKSCWLNPRESGSAIYIPVVQGLGGVTYFYFLLYWAKMGFDKSLENYGFGVFVKVKNHHLYLTKKTIKGVFFTLL